MDRFYSFECVVKGTNWHQTVNARTRGQAKVDYWRDVRESWPDVPYTAVLCRKVGNPCTTERFAQNATYRGLPGLKCGQRVLVGQARGTIVDHDAAANFVVDFDQSSPQYAGQRLSVHPSEMVLEKEQAQTLLTSPTGPTSQAQQ